MRNKETVKIDGYTQFCLTAIVILMTLLIIGLWANSHWMNLTSTAGVAQAADSQNLQGIPNAGAQRLAILKAIQTTNNKLDKIITMLNSGQIKVVIAKPQKDEKQENAEKQ